MTLAEKLIVEYTSMALIFSVGSANVAQLVEQRIRNAWVAGFCSEKTAPVLYPLFLRGSAFGGLRFLLFLLLDFDTVGKNQNRHAWFSII